MEHMQAHAMGEHLLGFAQTLRSGATFVEATADRMRSEFPDPADRTVTQADIDVAHAYVARVRATGYTAGEIAQLHALGLNDDAIARAKVDQTLYRPGRRRPGRARRGVRHARRAHARRRDPGGGASRRRPGRSRAAATSTRRLRSPRAGTPAADGLDRGLPRRHREPGRRPARRSPGTSATAGARRARGRHGHATRSRAGAAYTVTLTATDDYGERSPRTSSSLLGCRTRSRRRPSSPRPRAARRRSRSQFDASASADTDGTIESYEWDFGDATVGVGKTSAHTYTARAPTTCG